MSVTLDVEDIRTLLPHRYPMLLVDRIVEIEPGKRAIGLKNVSINEPFFNGHFPGQAVMPGALIMEAMAQVAGLMMLSCPEYEGKIPFIGGIEKVRFRRPVVPGDTLTTETTTVWVRGLLGKVRLVGRVDGGVVAECLMSFALKEPSASAGGQEKIRPGVEDRNGGNGKDWTNLRHRRAEETAIMAKWHIHASAVIDETAEIDPEAVIGAFCVIGPKVQIGAGTILHPNVHIVQNTRIGRNCQVHSGAVIGGAPQDHKFKDEESYVVIGDGNILREYVTIHRATGENNVTSIGDHNMVMAYAHIGHNCDIGSHVTIASYVGISGHVTVEDSANFGGICGVHQFCRVGKLAMIGGMSGIVQDIPPYMLVAGRPAKVYDVNVRGLRRAGVPPKVRGELRQACKLLYRSDLNQSQALEAIEEEIEKSAELEHLLAFIQNTRGGQNGRGNQ